MHAVLDVTLADAVTPSTEPSDHYPAFPDAGSDISLT